MNTRSTKFLALSAVTLMAMSACSSKESATPAASPSSSSSAAGNAASSKASTSPEATAAASSETSSTEGSGGAAAKSYTDAQLAAMLKGAKAKGIALEPAPASLTNQLKKTDATQQIVKAMQQATVNPAECKTASLEAAKLAPVGTSVAVSGAEKLPLVVLRSLKSSDDAVKLMEAQKKTSEACKSYSMTMTAQGKKISMKAVTKDLKLDSATSQDESGQLTTLTMDGQTMPTTTAFGHVDNVLIQVTSLSKTPVSESDLSTILEDVAKAVDAKK